MTEANSPPNTSIRIGDCLIKEGFATAMDVYNALKIQQKEEKTYRFSRETIFPPVNTWSSGQRQLIFHESPLNDNIGAISVQKGLLGKERLANILQSKRNSETPAEILIRHGYLTAEGIEEILFELLGADQFGEFSVKLDFLKPRDLKPPPRNRPSPRTLGKILCESGIINPADLDYVLKKYSKQLKLGEILIKQGVLNQNQLMAALREQLHQEQPLGQLLLEKNFISLDQLYQALSTQHHLPFKQISRLNLDDSQRKALVNIVGAKYAQKNQVLPLSLEDNRLTIAIHNPEHIGAAADIHNVYSHLAITTVFITEDNYLRLFEEIYQTGLMSDKSQTPTTRKTNLDALEINLNTEIEEKSPKDKTNYGLSNIEAQELVNYIVKYGIGNNASDIHLEQDRKTPRLRYRIDGMLHTLQVKWLDQKLHELINAVISRIKVISGLDIAERRLPQDGVFRVNYFDPQQSEHVYLDFRVATCPGIAGENMTIRILDPRKAKVDINQLGHSHHVINPLKQFLKSSAGMVLVSGPTGSGKTSTLYSALQYIFDPAIKIITAEDPIEYSFPGIMQTQVNSKINLNFARLLRSFLRLDPDAILIGEIRDNETAQISFDAAQTGHLMLSTVHTNDSVGAIPRLFDLGIDYNQMASSLMCVLAQRLIRKNCAECTVPYIPAEEEWEPLFKNFPAHLNFFQGEGCPTCNFTGYQGRTLISEILVVDPEIARALNREASSREIKQIALQNGMKTMLDDGISKLEFTTLNELVRVVPNEMLKEFRSRPENN